MMILSVVVFVILLTMFSIEGEDQYLKNCKEFNVQCEPGKVRSKTREIWLWLKDQWDNSRETHSEQLKRKAHQTVK